MSRTVGTILAAAGAAVLIATGIGAAAGLAIFGSLAGLTVAGASIGTLLTISSALTAVGGLISQLGTKAPKPESTETALKVATPARVSGYGRNRYYMNFALYVTARDGTAVDVGVFHDGRINAIVGHYLGDTKVTLLSGGRVQAGEGGQFGELSDIVKIFTTLGPAINTAFSAVIAKVPDQWTSAHRGDGCVTAAVLSAAVKAKNYQMIYPNGGPNSMPLSLVIEAQPVFDWRDPSQSVGDPLTWKYSENTILHLAHYVLVRKSIGPTRPPSDPAYWSDLAALYTARWNRLFAPTVAFWTDAADDCDDPIPLKGVQTILVEAADSGSGHITVTSTNGLSTGMTVLISATGDTSLAEARTVTGITTNSAGFVLTVNDALDEDHPSGSQVTWSSAGGSPATEPKYRSCVAHKHTDDHKGVIANLLAACDGWMSARADGALVVFSGRYIEPDEADEIGPDEIISYSLQDGVEEESAINQIAVSYVSANHDYATVETDPWVDDDDIAERGKVLAETLSNQVPSHSQARRMAKRAMSEVMATKRGTASTNFLGRKAIGKRYIPLRLREAGVTFFEGPVQIKKLVRNISTGGVTFEWIAADPNVDNWDPGTEEGDPAPVGNRPAVEPLLDPEITSAVAALDADSLRIVLTVSGPDREDLTWFVRWRVDGAFAWGAVDEYPDADPGPSVELRTGLVPVNATIELQAAYRIGDGRYSAWSASEIVDTSSLAPSVVTNLEVIGLVGGVLATWINPSSPTFNYCRVFHSDTANFDDAVPVGFDIHYINAPGTAQTANLSDDPGVHNYWVVPYSVSNVAGEPTGPVTATVT